MIDETISNYITPASHPAQPLEKRPILAFHIKLMWESRLKRPN